MRPHYSKTIRVEDTFALAIELLRLFLLSVVSVVENKALFNVGGVDERVVCLS